MKKILLSVSMLFLSIIAYCGCPTASGIIFHSGASPDEYTLALNFIRNGELFHVEDVINCDGVVIGSGCNTFNVNTTMFVQFTCTGTPSATINTFTGPCGNNSTPCATFIVDAPPSGGTTPVVLSNFSIQRNGAAVSAFWQSQQEINADKFEVERSFDNKSFQSVGTVSSHGNSSTLNNYSFVDNSNNRRGISLYRIKLIDKDGSVKYTEVKTAKGLSTASVDISLYPNPVAGGAQTNIANLKEPSSIQIVDYSGRIINSVTTGNNSNFPLPLLQKGTYFIKITGNESKLSTIKKLTVIE